MKRYHSSLNASLKIRSMLEKIPMDSERYQHVHRRLMDQEIMCQHMDEKIYHAVRNMYIESEYFNHLKTTKS